jgi:DNA-binding CsgD family transcriptional regulator
MQSEKAESSTDSRWVQSAAVIYSDRKRVDAEGKPETSGATSFARREISSLVQRLSPRHKEVLLMLRAGFQNRDMAIRLGVSVRTIKAYLNQLFIMFDVENRTELLGSVVDLGILDEVVSEPPRGQLSRVGTTGME